MKLACAIFLFSFVLYSEARPGHHEQIRPAKQKCIADLGLSEDVIKPFFKNPQQETNDENVKCFFRCFMQEMNTMDTNGNIVEPPNSGDAPSHMAQAFNECRTVTGSNDCDKAYNFHKCIVARKQASHQH